MQRRGTLAVLQTTSDTFVFAFNQQIVFGPATFRNTFLVNFRKHTLYPTLNSWS
jgi:hypothetical protein